jgi:hypothetical protein
MFESKVLRRILGPKRGDLTRLEKMHNEELHSLFCSSNKVSMINSRMRQDSTCRIYGEMRNVY